MQAAVIRKNGNPDVLKVENVADPVCGRGEVVVAVRSAALNHLDIWVRKGRPGVPLNAPHVMGSDASGVVLSCGSDVHGIQPGMEVVINPGISCQVCEHCLRGDQSACISFGILGMSRWGTYAEKVVVPAVNIQPKPQHLSFNQAAALSLSHLTAWHILMRHGKMRPGETILIHGIGGGVALAALQLAVHSGAETIVTSSSDSKLTRAKQLGARHILNYIGEKNLADSIRDITQGRGVDLCVNTIGQAGLPIDFQCVRKGGRIVLCGVTTGATAEINLQQLYWNQISLLGSTMGSIEDYREMIRFVNFTGLIPIIDSIHPLEQIRQATEKMETGRQFGKIVLQIEKPDVPRGTPG